MNELVVFTPAYNCEKKIETTIYSVLGQTYKNWKMFIVDDASTDKTSDFIKDFIDKLKIEDKVFLVNNKKNLGKIKNLLNLVEKIDKNSVMLHLDAGDFLIDLGLFDILNDHYSRFDPAVLWTKHRWSFSNINISGPKNADISLYEQPWKTSHLKTYRLKEFMGLNKENFKDENGEYFKVAQDQAIFLPMMERARLNNKVLAFYDKVTYHYDINMDDPELFKSDRSYKQKKSAEWIRARGYIE